MLLVLQPMTDLFTATPTVSGKHSATLTAIRYYSLKVSHVCRFNGAYSYVLIYIAVYICVHCE